MKTAIGTAHGWISLQPDGSVQFRPLSSTPGPWETFDFPGLTVAPPQPGLPQPEPPTTTDPAGPAEPTATYVGRVKAQCQAEGINLSGSCGAFAITRRVAWGLRMHGIGLVSKPNGNNCEGYSVDYLCYQNGDGVDILGDAGGQNNPQWAAKPGEFTGQDRWRIPAKP